MTGVDKNYYIHRPRPRTDYNASRALNAWRGSWPEFIKTILMTHHELVFNIEITKFIIQDYNFFENPRSLWKGWMDVGWKDAGWTDAGMKWRGDDVTGVELTGLNWRGMNWRGMNWHGSAISIKIEMENIKLNLFF